MSCSAATARMCATTRSMPRIAVARALAVGAGELRVDEHEPAGVGDEVGGVEDPAAGELDRQRVVRELVVGRAAHDARAQRRHRVLVEDPAERAGGEDVDIGQQRVIRRHPGRARQLVDEGALALVDVGDDHVRPVRDEHPHEVLADVAGADDRRSAAGQLGRVEAVRDARADRGVHAERGVRARVAEPAEALGQADDVLGARGDEAHVGGGGADVLRRDVAAPEQLDAVGEVEQHRVAQLVRELRARLDRDHALAAAEGDAGDRRLERHAGRQPQHVAERLAGMRVGRHPAAAERGPELRRMHRDDRVGAAAWTAADVQLLVIEAGQIHRVRSPIRSETCCDPGWPLTAAGASDRCLNLRQPR